MDFFIIWNNYIQSLISILLLIIIQLIEIAQIFWSASELFSLQNLSRHDKAANARDQLCDFLQTNSFGNEKTAEKLCVSSPSVVSMLMSKYK